MNDLSNTLHRLQRWYAAQCNGEWEHRFGVQIQSLDNPGWLVKVDLVGTSMAERSFATLSDGLGPNDHPVGPQWFHCRIRDGI